MTEKGREMLLYWTTGSTPCWRVMIVLEEKGFRDCCKQHVEYTDVKNSEEIASLNPRRKVPTFRDKDFIVNESDAICNYLETRYKGYGNQLIPSDAASMSKVFQRMHEASNNFMQFIIQDLLYYTWYTDPKYIDEKKRGTSIEKGREEFSIWDKYLKEEQKKGFQHITGEEFTMADVYLYTNIAISVHMGLDIQKYPHLKEYYDRLYERPSIKSTWPTNYTKSQNKYTFLSDI